MAAKQNNCGKGSKPSNAQSRFSIPRKRKADELLDTTNDGSISHLSEEEKACVILELNSNKKSSGATNLSSSSTLSHFSSVNHSKDKPVDNINNHSIQGHPCQNYETKDISLTCNQPIEVKHVSYDIHSMDRSPNHHSNYSVDKLTSPEDTNSTRDVQDNSNGHNDLVYDKGIQTQNGIKTWDEDVLRVQSNGEELKQANSNAHQTSSPIYDSEETFVARNSQGDLSFCTESINTVSMIPATNHAYKKHPIDQTSDGNACKNNITEVQQLPKCGQKEQKQAAVREIYICLICKKDFRQSGNFNKHMKSHRESPHHCKCGNCGLEFDHEEKLLQHMQEHTGSNPYKCELCDRKFRQFNNLRRHLRSHREKKFKCGLCHQKYNEVYYLNMHMGSHTGHREFRCGVCDSKFTSTSDLKKHVNTHPKSELYVCDVCEKAFSKACVLRQHMKKHDGKRPYKCKLCHKSYIHRHHLDMHMGTHTESKRFACKLCNKEFSQISHFNKHQKQHLVEVKLSDSSSEESNGRQEKVMNTLGINSIPDELNGVPSNLQQKPKAKPVRKRSRGPRKKAVSTNPSAYLHHASQISEANPIPYDSADPGMFGPLSNEATQNVMKQMMYFPLPDHLTHQNPMYIAFAPAFIAAHCTNLNMMNYQSHSGNGLKNDYAQNKSFQNRNTLSYESPKPLFHTSDFSPTVNSARSTQVSSASIYKERKQYFHNSAFAKPVQFLNCNMPVTVNGPFDLSLPKTQKRSKYGSTGENDMEDLSSRGSHGSSSPYATSSISSQPDTSRDSSPIDSLISTINSTKPRRQDQSKLDRFPVEPLGMITSQSNSKHPPLYPLRSSIHSVHRKENNDSKCDKPVGISSFPDDCSIQQQRKRVRHKTNYSSNMDFEMRKMLNSPDLTRSTALEDSKLEYYRKMKVKDEKLDEREAYAEEENQGEDNTSQPDETSCGKQQIEEVREMIQHEIKKNPSDAMIDDEEEEEEEGRLVIVEQDTEMQALDNKTFAAENAELEKRYSVACQNEMFSQRMQHDWKNTFRKDTLQGPEIESICCKKSVDNGECNHGNHEEKTIQQVSADLRWANNVETSRSHSAVQINSPFDTLQPSATLPFQRAVNNFDFNNSSGIVLDMSMKHSPAEKQQIHWKQMQCNQLYIAKKLHESASSPSEETVLKLAKKNACQGMRDEGIYVSQNTHEEPMDLTEKAFSKIKSRTVENLSDHNESKYHLFCKCCKKPMLNEVALSLHLSKYRRCFYSRYLGRSPVSLRKIDNDCSADSGTLRQIVEPLSGRTSEPTTDRGKKASLNCDMTASQTVEGSQLHVPVSSQHYMPIMAHYNQSISSSQPHIYVLQQEALSSFYSGGILHKQEQIFPLALVKKETSYVDPISTPRNCVHMPVEEKIGVEMRKSVPTTEAQFCSKSFPSSSDLEAHQNEHVPPKDGHYTYEFCDSAFSIPFDLQRHMLTRTNANETQQHNDTTEETRSLKNRKSIEQGQPYLNFSDFKNGINIQYKCDICEDVFENVKFYKDHKETHTGEKPYRCPQCSRGFTNTQNLNRHLMSHNAKTFFCKVCDRGFKGDLYLNMHMKVHAEVKNCRCEICGQHIPKSDLWQHIIVHLSTLDQNPTYVQIGERLKEILKEQKFSGDSISFEAVNEHLKKYLPVSEGLETLDGIMTKLKDFQAGKEKEDDGEANFSSVSDGSVYSSNDESKRGCHNPTKGKSTQKKFQQVCPICNRAFKTKRDFGNHLGVHNGERTHICKLCGKGFKKSCILRQHEKIHSSVRPFKCEVCGAHFLHHHHFQTHSHVHNGDKPYKCHICGVGFKHSSNLPKHLEIHKLNSGNQNDNQSKDI